MVQRLGDMAGIWSLKRLRRVCRVPGVSKVLVQRVEYPHILHCEVVVEHLTILFDPLLSDRFWYGYEVVLETPAYQDLSWGLVVFFGDRLDFWMVQLLALRQGTVCFELDLVLLAVVSNCF